MTVRSSRRNLYSAEIECAPAAPNVHDASFAIPRALVGALAVVAPLLGVNGLVFIAHGRSDALAIKSAVRVAKEAAEAKVLDAMKSAIEENLKK